MYAIVICIALGLVRRGVYISSRRGAFQVAYPFLGAMRRPEIRDKRRERHYSHVFFVPNSLAVFEMANDDRQGSVGQHLCVP